MKLLRLASLMIGFAQPANAFIGGEPGRELFPASVAIFSAERCSGVKIAPKQILTAAHCVWPDGARPDVASAPRVSISDGTFSNEYVVSAYFIHPSWSPLLDEQKRQMADDVAIVETTEELTGLPEAVISTRAVSPGEHVTVGGFGIGSPLAPREYGKPQIRNLSVAEKVITQVLPNSFVVPPADAAAAHISLAYRGDSGGPAYRCATAVTCEVVGLNSWVDDLLNITFPVVDESGAIDYARFVLVGNERADLHLKKIVDPARPSSDILAWIKRNAPAAQFH